MIMKSKEQHDRLMPPGEEGRGIRGRGSPPHMGGGDEDE